jgi:hypothetical protein
MIQLVVWLFTAFLIIAAISMAFAVLLRPFKVIVLVFIAVMFVWFVAIVISGILQKVFGYGGWLLENSAPWALIYSRCTGVLIGMLVISLIYRWVVQVIARRKEA